MPFKRILLILALTTLVLANLPAGDKEGFFIINFSNADIAWNPHNSFSTTEAQIYTALFEGLVSYNPVTCRPEPGIAERWEISRDRKTYTFYLRENLTFSDGTPLTAQTVRDSWLAIMSPESGAEYGANLDIIEMAREYRTGQAEADKVGIKTTGDRILVVRLNRAAPHFLSILCHYSFVPIHPGFLETEDWNSLESFPTNGPFVIRSRSETEVILVKSDSYWDKDSVTLPGVRITFSEETEAVMKRFNRYEIDWVDSGMDLNQLLIRESLIVGPQFSTTYMFFNNGQKPFDNPEVRRALGLLIPWTEIRGKQLVPGQTLVPPIPTYPSAKGITRQNSKEAMTILGKEGYADGAGLPDIVIRSPYPEGQDPIADLIKENWEKALKIKVTVTHVPFNTYYDSLSDGEYTIAMMIWVGDYPDPLTFLEMWESGHSLNESHYNNPAYDKLLERAADAPSEDRYRLLSEAESLLLTTSQVMPIEHLPSVNLIDVRFVDGWYVNALDIHPFKYLKFKNGLVIPGSI
jgi:peptide/nickel transport system substrate-binding protein/oligopeptide transport system substrate-binding protein